MKRWWLVGVALLIAALVVWFVRPHHDGATPAAPPVAAGSGSSTAPRAPGTAAAPGPIALPAWVAQRGVAGKRIAGTVTADGKPVEGAEVQLGGQMIGRESLATASTDAAGKFDLGVRPAATYRVSASAPEKVGASLEVDLRDPTAKPPSDQLALKLLSCTATVSGHLRDAAGPIDRARVRIGATTALTDAAGAYRICARLGNQQLFADAAGYGAVHVMLSVTADTVQDLILLPEIAISGRVVRAADNAPIADAIVWVSPADSWRPSAGTGTTAITDAEGRFRAAGLVPGRITVGANAAGLSTASAAQVTLVVGETPPEVVVKLVPTLEVRGKVVLAGAPVAGARVRATRLSPLGYSNDAVSQTDGSFTLAHVWPGDSTLQAEPYEVLSPKQLAIAKDLDGVVVELSALATIRGRLLHAKQPVPRGSVRVIGGNKNFEVVADGDGAYEAKGLAPGGYKLYATGLEVDAFSNAVAVTLAAGEVKDNVDIDLAFAGTIDGRVVDQTGAGVASVFVRFTQPSGDLGESATGPDGSFHCPAMTGGAAYVPEVFATRGGARPFAWAGPPPQPVMLADGASHATGIALAIQRDHLKIAGTVVDTTGAPVPDVRVRAAVAPASGEPELNSWIALPTATTDASGAFSISDLPAGTYALQAHAPDSSEAIAQNIAAGTTGVKITVQRAASIEGTLAGFTEPPVVYAHDRREESRFQPAQVDGTTFSIHNLAPGPYTLTAQSPREGDAIHLDLAPGVTAHPTLTSHGRGSVQATLVAFGGVGGVPSGHVCHVVLRAGDESGITNWDPATAPKADAQGHVVIDPAPAGDITVQCYEGTGAWSDGVALASVAQNGSASVTLVVVKNTLSGDAANSGEIGVALTGELGGRIASVTADSPAARAGIVAGDEITAIDGAAVTGITPGGIYTLIQNHPIGAKVEVGIRHGNTQRTASLTVVVNH